MHDRIMMSMAYHVVSTVSDSILEVQCLWENYLIVYVVYAKIKQPNFIIHAMLKTTWRLQRYNYDALVVDIIRQVCIAFWLATEAVDY